MFCCRCLRILPLFKLDVDGVVIGSLILKFVLNCLVVDGACVGLIFVVYEVKYIFGISSLIDEGVDNCGGNKGGGGGGDNFVVVID